MKKDLFAAGLICILLGEVTPFFGAAFYWRVFTIVGLAIIALCFLPEGEKKKLESLFKACKLYTELDKEKKVPPKVISKTEFENGYQYHLSLPKGLSTKDFNEKKQAIAEALDSEVEFSYDNGRILMKVTKGLLKNP